MESYRIITLLAKVLRNTIKLFASEAFIKIQGSFEADIFAMIFRNN